MTAVLTDARIERIYLHGWMLLRIPRMDRWPVRINEPMNTAEAVATLYER